MACKICKGRKWVVNPLTRQREDCPQCKPTVTKKPEPKPKTEKKKVKSFSEGVGTNEQTTD